MSTPWGRRLGPISRWQLRLRRDESGQSLVLVTMIGVLATLMVTTATTTLTAQIRPAKATVDAGEATAAAQAGLENFVSWVNTNCPPTEGFLCPSLVTGLTSNGMHLTDPANQKGVSIVGGDGAASAESFYWTVTYATSGLARVKSVGQVPTNRSSPKYLTRVLVADIDATPSFENFQYYTKYETYSSDFIDSFYRQRTIQLTGSESLSNTSISSMSKTGTLSWPGVCRYDATGNPSCDRNHSSNVCDALYYDSSNGPGRGEDGQWNNGVRRPSATVQTALGTDPSFAYYSESGTYTPSSGTQAAVTHNDTCDSSMEPNMQMYGPVYSQDAYLIDRGDPTGNAKGSMPQFSGAAFSVWNGTENGLQQQLGPDHGYIRVYPGTDGDADLLSSYPSTGAAGQVFPIYQSKALELPPDATEAEPLAQCVYTGPTRIVLDGTVAHITSPLTPAGSSACYQSTGSYLNVNTADGNGHGTTDSSGGVINATVPLSRSVIYIANPDSSVQPSTATPASPVFNTRTNLTVPPTQYVDGLTGSWTDDATYVATANCPTPADPTKRRNFDCEASKATPKGDLFGAVKAAVDTGLASPTVSTTSLTSAITGQLSTASQTAGTTLGSVWYTVAVTGGTPSTPVTTKPDASTDPFLQTTQGVGYQTVTTPFTVAINRLTCTKLNKAGTKCATSSTKPLVTGTVSKAVSTANAGQLNTTQHFPWVGSSYTDPNNDITQYSHGYGDAYVEGTTNANVSIIAEHDILVTNDLTYGSTAANITATTPYGLTLVATHNVRLYRPMTCTSDGTAGATTPGYCPNDLTGVYNTKISWPLASNYPSNAYTAAAAPSITSTGTGTIYASIFALRGSFLADNFYRGAIGDNITVYGGLYQYHRGPTSLPYQGRPYQGSGTKMPGILLKYQYDNMRAGNSVNGGLRVPYIPIPEGRTSNNTWNVISISTGS